VPSSYRAATSSYLVVAATSSYLVVAATSSYLVVAASSFTAVAASTLNANPSWQVDPSSLAQVPSSLQVDPS